MSLKRKVPLICFLVLTMVSSFFLSYTLYITFGTTWALRSIYVSLPDVKINEDVSEAYFPLSICNPTSIHLKVFFLKVEIYFNGSYLGKSQSGFQSEPQWFSPSMEKNLTIPLTSNNQISYSNGVWKLVVTVMIETPLPQRTTITRSISLEK
jgi:LEA14-like dessication related protein